jgi:ssDNA-binding Zn-finger/Zn-ribbon topoisomerase 1
MSTVKHNLGDTITSAELGFKGREIRVWDSCITCNAERWVRVSAKGRNCKTCATIQRTPTKTSNIASTLWVNEQVPKCGDKALFKDVGRKGTGYVIWSICPKCGKGRWVAQKQHALNTFCLACANSRRLMGQANPRWNNHVRYDPSHGFYVKVPLDSPYYEMSISAGGQKYIAEHRLQMAEKMGRILEKWEVVHHINGDNTDNRIENLELLPTQSQHLPYNILQSEIYKLRDKVQSLNSRILQLEADNILLRSQVVGMSIPNQTEEQCSSGVCRDLTGDSQSVRLGPDEEKVHAYRKL